MRNRLLQVRVLPASSSTGTKSMTDEGRVKRIARQLCRAAAKDPDKTVRIGASLTLNVGGWQVTKLLMRPA